MDEKIDEVIRQYPLQVTGKKRIRGAILLEAREGLFSLSNCRESLSHLIFLENVKKLAIEQGYSYVDEGLCNENGELLSKDSRGGRWLVKRWYRARECSLHDEGEILCAARHLAKLHTMLQLPEPAQEHIGKNMPEGMERHIREMKRVYNYIRSKKQRNDMEICILQMFGQFYEQACQVREYLRELDCAALQQTCIGQGRVYHGSYNYHNVLFQDAQIVTTNFEAAGCGIQIVDLYDFLRKMLEKNEWDSAQGMRILDRYCRERQLLPKEGQFLYLLLLFPEKFWKQMNFYYNGKKSWMSMRNYDKLLKIQEQEKRRQKFLREAKGLLF